MRWMYLTFAVILAGSCATGTEPAATEIAPPVTSVATTAPRPTVPSISTTPAPPALSTTTTTSVPSVSIPPLVKFGDSGLWRIEAGEEIRLLDEPVVWAADDAMGGVLLRVEDDPGLLWLKGVAEAVERLPYRDGTPVVVDGRPSLIVPSWDFETCDIETLLLLVDLGTAAEREIGCFGGEDGGVWLASGGGELLLGQAWLAVGSNGTSLDFRFYSPDGDAVDVTHNPFPASCAPCELDGILSPDGSTLAYRHRPDAKWSLDHERLLELDAMTPEAWWETTRSIPAQVVVVDLTTGDEQFRMTVPAAERLVDFDGRYVVSETSLWDDKAAKWVFSSRVIDTTQVGPGTELAGRVRFAREAVAAPSATDVFPPSLAVWNPSDGAEIESDRVTFSGVAEYGATLLAAGRYTIDIGEDGYWSTVLVLRPGWNTATFTATDPAGNESTVHVRVRSIVPVAELMIGVWEGTPTVPEFWSEIGPVRLEFRSDGTYAAESYGDLPALYWGENGEGPLYTYEVSGPQPGWGQIAVVWDGATVQLGRMDMISVEQDALHFELWNDWGESPPYGPVIYDLTRLTP